ncbi:HpaII family restriction endonuclease [Streptococcus suis]
MEAQSLVSHQHSWWFSCFSLREKLARSHNASGATRIHYRCSSDVSEKLREQVHSISTKNKIKDRIQCLKENKVELIFDSLPNSTFERNLQMIDYRMPEILAYLFLISYSVNGKSVSDVVKTYCQLYNEDMELVEYKVKDLLVAIALGMEPNSKWSGLEDANGGYIVVKEDGEILCYHIYDRNKLREYLYRNTKFDSPSSKRTGAGMFFSEDEQEKFSLTVQIRF